MSVTIIGVDPGFASIGLCVVKVAVLSGCKSVSVVGSKVITTKPSAKKRRMRKCDDEHSRLSEIESAFASFLVKYDPDLISAEEFPSLRSASATRQIALAYGAMHAIAKLRGIVFVNHSPQEVKIAVVGKRSASKDEMLTAIKAKFPTIVLPKTKQCEHVVDACGAALAACDDVLVDVLMRSRG